MSSKLGVLKLDKSTVLKDEHFSKALSNIVKFGTLKFVKSTDVNDGQ